jgi:CheY-like chemotaxis protein
MNRTVVAAVSDMIFAAKVNGAAEQHNISVNFVRSLDGLLTTAREKSPAMILLDLNNPRFDPLTAIKDLKNDAELATIPIIGFLSHVQVDLKRNAIEIGCDRVMPRSEFSKHLGEILSGKY